MTRKILIICLALLPTLFTTALANADEITVSGNGSDSQSNVSVNNTSTTALNQNNEADVNNNVDINADTGNNKANDNTGGNTAITTGDASVNSSIDNSNINNSVASNVCCAPGTNISVSGNGSGSQNSVSSTQNNQVTININQNANISNYVNGYVNTGNNQANGNTGGNVSISTGSIYATDTIKNKWINISSLRIADGGQSVFLKVDGNGSDSVNTINLNIDSLIDISVNNSATIVNNSNWDLNTGGNRANDNSGGSVSITTGDIIFESVIENGPINVTLVDVECCEKEKEKEIPPGAAPPQVPTQNGANGAGNGVGKAGEVLAAAISPGDILPVTGGLWTILMIIGSIMMFFFGWYLRLRSGRSPNFLVAA
ncbi:MAG: hypothetical protein HYW63_03410 [Candidatus Levybacteria bacterium]|nr:hypothetical protein [Candidatus Levybacteria bacterium]